jgi:hypothetical protein
VAVTPVEEVIASRSGTAEKGAALAALEREVEPEAMAREERTGGD